MGKRIMTVDSNVIVLDVYLNILGAEGYEVSAATGGLQALRQLKEAPHAPDLLLLEIDLLDMSGWELLHTIRQRVEWCDLPVMVVSTFVEPSAAEFDSGPPYQRYLSKMETARTLVKMVGELIGEGSREEASAPEEDDLSEVWRLAA
jgi:CheY-like chemotaxis protein